METTLPPRCAAQVVEAVEGRQPAWLPITRQVRALRFHQRYRSYPQQRGAALVLGHCRGMSPVRTGEELAKPAEVPLLTGRVCCGQSAPVEGLCAVLWKHFRCQLKQVPKYGKISRDTQLLTEGQGNGKKGDVLARAAPRKVVAESTDLASEGDDDRKHIHSHIPFSHEG